MAACGPGINHPAKKLTACLLPLLLLTWILSLIAIFVPWSWKDIAVFQRMYVGLWENCLEITNHPLGQYICENNDVDIVASVAGGSLKCRGYIVAAQVLTVATVCFAFLALIFAFLLLGKLWAKPIVLAFYVATLALITFGCCLTAFLMWIIYAEQYCLRCEDVLTAFPSYYGGSTTDSNTGSNAYGYWNGTAWVYDNVTAIYNNTYFNNSNCPLIPQPRCTLFPLKGYSWGWICMVCATFFAFLAMLLAYLILLKILLFKPFIPHDEPCCPQQPCCPPVMEAPLCMSQPYYEPCAMPAYAPAYAPAMAPCYSPILPAY